MSVRGETAAIRGLLRERRLDAALEAVERARAAQDAVADALLEGVRVELGRSTDHGPRCARLVANRGFTVARGDQPLLDLALLATVAVAKGERAAELRSALRHADLDHVAGAPAPALSALLVSLRELAPSTVAVKYASEALLGALDGLGALDALELLYPKVEVDISSLARRFGLSALYLQADRVSPTGELPATLRRLTLASREVVRTPWSLRGTHLQHLTLARVAAPELPATLETLALNEPPETTLELCGLPALRSFYLSGGADLRQLTARRLPALIRCTLDTCPALHRVELDELPALSELNGWRLPIELPAVSPPADDLHMLAASADESTRGKAAELARDDPSASAVLARLLVDPSSWVVARAVEAAAGSGRAELVMAALVDPSTPGRPWLLTELAAYGAELRAQVQARTRELTEDADPRVSQVARWVQAASAPSLPRGEPEPEPASLGAPLRVLALDELPGAASSRFVAIGADSKRLMVDLPDDAVLPELPELRHLSVRSTSLCSLRPFLRWTALQSLNVAGCPRLDDLEGVTRLAALDELAVGRTPLADLTPLAEHPSLRALYLDRSKVRDLAPLRGMPRLTRLSLERCRVRDLAPCAAIEHLRVLHLDYGAVRDLSPLGGAAALRVLSARGLAHVESAAAVAGLPALEVLDLSGTAVSDPEPLLAHPRLRILCAEGAPLVEDRLARRLLRARLKERGGELVDLLLPSHWR